MLNYLPSFLNSALQLYFVDENAEVENSMPQWDEKLLAEITLPTEFFTGLKPVTAGEEGKVSEACETIQRV